MYNIEPNKTIQRIIKTLYHTGIWRNEEEYTFRKTGRKVLFLIYLFAFQVFNDVSAFLSNDKNELIFLTEIGMFYAVMTFKQVYLLWKKDEIIAFLNDPITAHSTECSELSEHVNGKLNKFMRFVNVYLYMLGVTSSFIGISCFPIFTTEKKLPFFISYSFNWTESEIIYWMTYGFVFLAIVLGFLINLVTIFIWYLMFNYSVAYEVLGHKLKNMGRGTPVVRREYSQSAELNSFHLMLIDSIKAHQNIFKYVNLSITKRIFKKFKKTYPRTIERFKSCFSALFLIQMTTSGISICVSTYNMAYVSKICNQRALCTKF